MGDDDLVGGGDDAPEPEARSGRTLNVWLADPSCRCMLVAAIRYFDCAGS
jgi:hypothetical protein